jgi:hypothetical protein
MRNKVKMLNMWRQPCSLFIRCAVHNSMQYFFSGLQVRERTESLPEEAGGVPNTRYMWIIAPGFLKVDNASCTVVLDWRKISKTI